MGREVKGEYFRNICKFQDIIGGYITSTRLNV